jgi:hypothetical protein
MVDNFKIIDDKKFMWDGKIYDTEADAQAVETTYKNDGFETRLLKENEKYLVYTRRVVTEVVVEGEPPI